MDRSPSGHIARPDVDVSCVRITDSDHERWSAHVAPSRASANMRIASAGSTFTLTVTSIVICDGIKMTTLSHESCCLQVACATDFIGN